MRKTIILGASLILSLFVIGGVISITRAANARNDANTELQAQIATREAAYNELIGQANQQIQTLNDQVTALQEGKNVVDGRQTIRVEDAVAAAQKEAGSDDYLMGVPELANYEGRTVYSVNFIDGTVYVDAFNGEVVYSSIPVKINEQQAIQIAANYLQVSDTSRATVQTVAVDGADFYKVTIGNYVVYIDAYGNITRVQVIQYAPQTSNASSSSSSSHESGEHEEHEDDD
jgi:hypothetical protein